MYRPLTDTWHADIRPRLDAAAQRHPDGQAWLTLLAEALRELKVPAWAAVAPQPDPERPAAAPLLAGVTLAVDPHMVRRWVRRLLQQAATVAHPSTTPLAAIATRRFDPLPLLEAAMCLDETRLADLAKADGTDPGALGALMHLATMPLLHVCGRYLAQQAPVEWSYGYCPVCGAWPTLAEVRGLERTRRWRCGRCGGDWGLALLRCPYCGEANHQRLGSLAADDDEATCTVETCLTCRGYVKTRAVLQPTPPYAVVLEDLATVEWDLVALARGYRRPTQPGYPLGVRLVEPPSRMRIFFGRLRRALH
jgi:FdhE protein